MSTIIIILFGCRWGRASSFGFSALALCRQKPNVLDRAMALFQLAANNAVEARIVYEPPRYVYISAAQYARK